MDDQVHSVEVSDGNEKHLSCRKDHSCYKVAKGLAELFSCPGVSWKVERE